MPNISVRQKVLGVSPHFEMLLRRIYWANVPKLEKFAKTKASKEDLTPINYSEVLSFLQSAGLKSGSLAVVHSAFGALKGRGKTANEVLDLLLGAVGGDGTLAMPAMPLFPNAVPTAEYLSDQSHMSRVFHYDPLKTKISTGVLPLMLNKRETSVRSCFPINSLVANGPLAAELFEDEFNSSDPLACGQGSSWFKCYEQNAFVISLGTDLTHSLTMIHVAEDGFEGDWPVADWYFRKNFIVTEGGEDRKLALRERAPKWGALHFGERTLCRDLMREKLMMSVIIDGVIVEILKARDLVDFLRDKQKVCPGYPYFWL